MLRVMSGYSYKGGDETMMTYQTFRSNIMSLVTDLDSVAAAKFEALDLNKALILIANKYDLDLADLVSLDFGVA